MANVFNLTSALIVLLANIIHIVGFSSNNWSVSKVYGGHSLRFGLWKACFSFKTSTALHEAWLEAVQAMECLGLFFLLVTAVLTAITLFRKLETKWHIISGALAVISSIFIFMGVIIFGTKNAEGFGFGYSFYLCICAAVLGVFAAVVSVTGVCIGQTGNTPHFQGTVYSTQQPTFQSAAIIATIPNVPQSVVIPSAPDEPQPTLVQMKSDVESPPAYSKVVETPYYLEPNTSNDNIPPPSYDMHLMFERTDQTVEN